MRPRPLKKRIARKTRRAWLLGTKRIIQAAWRRSDSARPDLHVFVAGAQRSGTNMVMGLLERSYQTDVYHERDSRAFDNYLMRDPNEIEQLARDSTAPVFVIKSLCELDRLPALIERFSPARVLWVLRHYDDVVNSSLRSFHRVPGQVADLVDDPDSHGWMGRGISRETWQQLRQLYHPEMNDASSVALFWYLRNRLLFDTGLAQKKVVTVVRYEELVAHPDEQVPHMFGSLGLKAPRNISGFLSASSIGRSPPPGIEPRVRSVCDELLQCVRDLKTEASP